MTYPIPKEIYDYLTDHPDATGAEVSRLFSRPGRTARRYVRKYKAGNAHSVSPLLRSERLLNIPVERNAAVVFDIEVTDFKTEGYVGHFLCCSFLPLDTDKVKTIQIKFDDHGDDREALKLVAKELAKYSYHIGHNIATFDYNWLNSRMMFHGMDTLNTALYFDTYQVARSLGIATRKGLGNLLDYFGLEGEKTAIYRTSWSGTFSPHKEEFKRTMDNIVYHCEQDVIGNRNLYNVLHYYAKRNGRINPWKVTKILGENWKA